MFTEVLDLCDQQLGQYRILAELGRGGFGCVYKASHALMDRIVALKVVAPERLEDERAREMFLREVRAATRLQHPNIALAYDAGEVDGRLFMAMEYVEGPTLEQLVRKDGPLAAVLAWSMLQQTAQALRYAHAQGMVHRDIKPANLLIPQTALDGADAAGQPALVKVVDFGLARVQSHTGAATLFAGRDKVFAGTPDFMSPEQARSLHDVDARSDLYSLGCTFYYALAGRKPFQGSTALEIVVAHLERQPEPLTALRADLPRALPQIVHRLLAKKPANRFQSADDLLAAMGVRPSWPQVVVPPAPPVSMIQSSAPVEEILAPTVQVTGDPAAAQTAFMATPEVAAQTEMEPSAPLPAAHEPSHTLQQSWSQWQDVVAALAKHRKPAIDSADYRTLHAKLLRALRDHAGPLTPTPLPAGERGRGEGAAAPFEQCARLLSLVEPWLNLQTLADTDAAMLRDLLARSRALAAGVGLCDSTSALPRWLLPAILVLLVLPLVAVASLQHSAGRLTWQAPSLPAAWQFVNAHPILTLALLLPASVLGGLHGLGRLLRT